jgi:ADP-heptose:LPS heptosyltransferase
VEVIITEAEREALRRKLAGVGIDLARPTVCMHPGASWRPRAWRVERWAALADRLEERYPVQTVFVGSAGERDLEAGLRARAPGRGRHFLFGTLSLREACVLLDRAALVVGNDSGLIHIAAACGTPVVGLYGPQLPDRFGPRSTRSIALHHRIDCCPCAQRVCVRPEDPCVNLITVEEVVAAAGSALGSEAP